MRKTKGRNKVYGLPAPTAEEIRQSEDVPWIKVTGWEAGKVHTFNVKVVKSLKWRAAGENDTIQLVIARPLG